MKTGSVLIVDDEQNLCRILARVLRDVGHTVEVAHNGEEALAKAHKNSFDCVLTDVRMPEMDGLTLLREFQKQDPEQAVIVMTAYGNIQLAQEVMRAGAFDYVIKPFENNEVIRLIGNAIEIRNLRTAHETLSEQLEHQMGPGELVGRSASMQTIGKAIAQVAATDATVLIQGESGTGKELVARAIHHSSSRADRPMVIVNCGAFPRDLIESELFGHEKGAFTNAYSAKPGLMEKAHQSTLFLDEIGELPLQLQVKLLRVLESGEVRRVGAVTPRRIDIRIVAATNRDLRKEQLEGRFREDLYYRLSTFPILIPPLRDRPEDIPVLVDHFINIAQRKMGHTVAGFTDEALVMLRNYPWPGNVRELQNIIERIVITRAGQMISVEDLPSEFRETISNHHPSSDTLASLPYREAKAHFEKQYFEALLARHDNNVSHSAEAAGLSRRHLQEKIKEYDISTSEREM